MWFFSGLIDILFPPRCAFCGKVLHAGDNGACGRCISSLPWTGRGQRSGDLFAGFDFCVSPLYYEGAVRDAILGFKFKNKRGYATCFGKLLAACISKELSGQYDVITWVPVSAERKKQRGYDQSMLICMAAALDLGDVALSVIEKTKEAPPQSSLKSAEERRGNIEGAYTVTEPELVTGRRVLLIDDILTTGATLSEAAKVLKNAGAKRVICVTLAKTRLEARERT